MSHVTKEQISNMTMNNIVDALYLMTDAQRGRLINAIRTEAYLLTGVLLHESVMHLYRTRNKASEPCPPMTQTCSNN